MDKQLLAHEEVPEEVMAASAPAMEALQQGPVPYHTKEGGLTNVGGSLGGGLYPDPPPPYDPHPQPPNTYPLMPTPAPVPVMPPPVPVVVQQQQPAAPVVVVTGAQLAPGVCSVCRAGKIKDSASCCTWLCCLLLLPFGLIPGIIAFCCCCRKPKCTNCGYTV